MLKLKNSHLVDDRSSQIVSWGHWFTLFNIFVVIILGSRYLFIADWPSTFMGRFYAIISAIGHFSFLTFISYLILLFPLSFFIHSSRWQRILAVIIATFGVSLLLIDIEVFLHFRMHLNFSIWKIVTSTGTAFLSRAFIFIPLVLCLEIVFAVWSWKKLRSLTKRRRYAKPVVILCIICFIGSHLIHIWADANFYRPITMQRSSLPLSYPLTARHLLERYGFIGEDYQTRLIEEGNPFAIAIEYPLGRIVAEPPSAQAMPNNILMIVIDGWDNTLLTQNMPWLTNFAKENIQFTNHYSASSQSYLSNFSLFYGIDPNYYNSILASHKPSVLLDTVASERYNLGFFSADGFAEPLYRHALLSNFTLPDPQKQTNKQTTDYWMAWSDEQNKLNNHAPLFSIVQFDLADSEKKMTLADFENSAKKIDQYIASIVAFLKASQAYDNTVIVITGTNGLDLDEAHKLVSYSRKNDFARSQLKVPLIMAWPNKQPAQINAATTHTDVMLTLMQDALHVTTPAQQYSQGVNLFTLHSDKDPKGDSKAHDDNVMDNGIRQWLIAGNENEIAALYKDKTIVLDASGHAKVYDLHNKLHKGEGINLPRFLQIVTANRRFMVMAN
ncbi:DUF3413 domain-containing protein [Orbaceae bacterium ESL0727]|nr:DUF3413 domain-containing protein [Orbaceae bacterium ESL0727]